MSIDPTQEAFGSEDHCIDGSGSVAERSYLKKLFQNVDEALKLLFQLYSRAKDWRIRSACVYYAMPYARDERLAVDLGVEALSDRSKIVRNRASQLLAYSLNERALPFLEKGRRCDAISNSHADFDAAIDAIRYKNSDYFVDRSHSGMIAMRVNKLTHAFVGMDQSSEAKKSS